MKNKLRKILYVVSLFIILMPDLAVVIGLPSSVILFLPAAVVVVVESIKWYHNMDDTEEISPQPEQELVSTDNRNVKQIEIDALRMDFERTKEKLDKAELILGQTVPNMEGTVYERYVGYMLENMNWRVITYTKITGDFGGDIIAMTPEGVRACIQCKRYAGLAGVDAVNEAHAGKDYYDCSEAYVCTTQGLTKPAIELANKIGVKVIILR